MLGSNAPLGLYIFALLFVNIDQIPLIWGMFRGQNEIKSPPLPVEGRWGNTLIGALGPSGAVHFTLDSNKGMGQHCRHLQ